MTESITEKLRYLFSKINWDTSFLDAKAVDIMNTISKEIKEVEEKAWKYDGLCK